MRALPAVLAILCGGGLLAPPALAQTWEIAPTGVWQTQTSSTYWEQGTASAMSLRGSWLGERNGASRTRVDVGWNAPASWSTRRVDGGFAELRSQSVFVGLGRESWFMENRLCFSVALDLRNTWLESTQLPATKVENHLPQLWMRVGIGARLWDLSAQDRRATDEPLRYALLRVEFGGAAPRGPSATDELLPQQEVTLACGIRF